MKAQRLIKYLDSQHSFTKMCPGCKKDLTATGLTYLVYEFVTCKCKKVSYAHLVEQLWHRSCFVAAKSRNGAEKK